MPPPYDQAQVDKRFLAELARLYEAEVLATYQEWARTLGVNPNYVAAIQAGRYHANLRLLYETARHYPAFDFQYVVFGAPAGQVRPGPAELPRRQRGPRARAG